MSGVGARILPTRFEDLEGWGSANLDLALQALKKSADEILSTAHGFKRSSVFSGFLEDWKSTCEAALLSKHARPFFETNFQPFKIEDETRRNGLFTGYYEPLARGSRVRSEHYQVPIYKRPPELAAFPAEAEAKTGLRYGRVLDGLPTPYFSRQEIERGALHGRGLEICWLADWIDAFFIHVQGSGRIELEDGTTLRLAFAAKNGQPYVSIGAALLAKGHGTPETMSMQFLRNWMKQNTAAARDLMWENKSFIFFREIEVSDPTLGALGAAQVNLTPLCSLAIDRHYWMFGTPFWLDTMTPPESKRGAEPFRHLMIGQDTGTAIRGALRGDVYWGWGDDAILNAGHMKSQGQMTALLPIPVIRRLGL